MKVKLLTSMATSDGMTAAAGQIVELEKAHAENMIASGQAEKVAARTTKSKSET